MTYEENKKEISDLLRFVKKGIVSVEVATAGILSFRKQDIMKALQAWGLREEDIHNHLLENGYIPEKEEE